VAIGTVTAIPGDHDESALILVCDHCGRTHNRVDQVVHDWRLLWTQAFTAGWRGQNHPAGPHHCFRCAD
jgi:hypothetical protein